jgi:hypothetical protein
MNEAFYWNFKFSQVDELSVVIFYRHLCDCHLKIETVRAEQSSSLLPATSQHGISWHRAPLGPMARYLFLFDSYGLVFCGAPSLTRGRVCLLYMLLALASTVFLRSESLGTRDHILLPQVWDFHFRRLLRLAGSRLRYSTPPPHLSLATDRLLLYSLRLDPIENTVLSCRVLCYLATHCSMVHRERSSYCCVFATELLPSSGSICHNILIEHYIKRIN